jgi:hypothetical protein
MNVFRLLEQSHSTTLNMDRQLLHQKSREKFLLTKTKKTGLIVCFDSLFVLKTTETPVYMFSLLKFFD